MIASTGGIEDNTWWSALEGATLDDGGWTYGICPSRGDGGSSQKPPASSDRGSIAFAKTMAISNGVRSRSHRQMTEPWYSLKPWRSAMELKYYSYYRWWLFHVDTNRNIVSPCMIIVFAPIFRFWFLSTISFLPSKRYCWKHTSLCRLCPSFVFLLFRLFRLHQDS